MISKNAPPRNVVKYNILHLFYDSRAGSADQLKYSLVLWVQSEMNRRFKVRTELFKLPQTCEGGPLKYKLLPSLELFQRKKKL